MARPKTTDNHQPGQSAAPATAEGETTSGYFRRIFREDRSLLKQGSNAAVFDRWLKDHPGQKEVPDNVKAILHNVKSTVRNKRKQKRAEKAEATAAAPAVLSLAVAHSTVKSLGRLEEEIDDCLMLARGMDREGFAEVIDLLRNARNQVVRQAGG
jgi:hypothetical protein